MKTKAYTTDQKRVLRVAAENPEASPKKVQELLGDDTIPVEYCNEIMTNFRLPDHEHPEKAPTLTNGMLQETAEDDDEQPPEDEFTPATRSRPLESLAPTSKDVIEYVRDNPDTAQGDIAKALEIGRGTVSNAVKRFCHLIPEDAEVFAHTTHPDDIEWDQITDQQQTIIEYINDHPGVGPGEVGDELGVAGGTVTTVVEKFPQFVNANAADGFKTLTKDASDVVPTAAVENREVNAGGRITATSGNATYDGPEEGVDATEQYVTERPEIGEVQETDDEDDHEIGDLQAIAQDITDENEDDGLDDEEVDEELEELEDLEEEIEAEQADDAEPVLGYEGINISERYFEELFAKAGAFDVLMDEIETMSEQAKTEKRYYANESAKLRAAVFETLLERAEELTEDVPEILEADE